MKKTHRKLKVIGIILGLLILIVLAGIIIFQAKVQGMVKEIKAQQVVDAPMQIDTYGKKSNPSLLMIHGMYMDGSNLKNLIEELEDDYYLIVPTMKGCDGNTDIVFDSIDDECLDIEDYIKENLNGHIDYGYGLSMGGTLLYNILQRDNITVDKAILDGLYVSHQGESMAYMTVKVMSGMMNDTTPKDEWEPSFLLKFAMTKGMGIPEKDIKEMCGTGFKNSPIRYENMERMAYFNYIYTIDPSKTIDHTKVYLWCGSNEPNAIASNNIVKPQIKDYEEKLYENTGHTQMALQHYKEYAKDIRSILIP